MVLENEKKEDKEKERCFVMMPISNQGDYPQGHFTKVYEQIFKPAIRQAGFEPYRVDENKICDSIMDEIFQAVQNCPMALCDLSNRNPNVLYELGLRQAYDKPVVLVQDEKTEKIFDVSGINTVGYNSVRLYENVMDARERIAEAIISTKEGRENSIVKVMKARTADNSSVSVSSEDKVAIMLNSMMQEIQELKDEQKNSAKCGRIPDNLYEPRIRQNSMSSIHEYRILLRPGITNEQIEEAIGNMEMIWGADIKYSRNREELVIYIRKANRAIESNILLELERRLGV